jgi:predicted DNA-binding transcriptional regulator YafY
MSTPKKPGKYILERLLRLHDLLNAAYHGKLPVRGDERMRSNCNGLSKELGVTPKTVSRDIAYLRDELKLEIDYDPGERGFAYVQEYPRFPLGHDLTFDERVALAVARQSLGNYLGVDLGSEVKSAFDKITGGELGAESALLHESLDRFISVRTPGAGRIEDPRVFRAVRHALLDQYELQIEYQAKGRPAFTPRRLHPYHLACIENRWVLVALDAEKQVIRTYVLARFRHPLVTKVTFPRPADFDPEKHLGTSFGSWTGTGTTVVKLRLSAEAAHHVIERQWHATQQVTRLPGGVVEVEFALSDLNDVTRWALGFGSDCEVLEPAVLRKRIAEEGQRMASINARA